MTFEFLKSLAIVSSFLMSGFSTVKVADNPTLRMGKDYDPSTITQNATELEREALDVSFMSASKTETSASFKLSIASSLLDAFFSDRYNNFYVAINQANSPTYTGKYVDYVNIADADYETFDSYIYLIKNDDPSKNRVVHIPSTFTRRGSFVMGVTGIGAEACVDFTNIDSIYIPNTIVSVESGAFKNVPSTVHIYCESETAPAGWATDWCDNMDVVTFGATYDRADDFKKLNSSNQTEFGEAENYIVGYKSNETYTGEQYNLPLVAEYQVIKPDSTKETRFYEIPLTSKKNAYDGVGRFATTLFMVNIDLSTAVGEEIDGSSFRLHNIFKAKKEGSNYTVDLENKYYAPIRVAYKNMLTIKDYFDISLLGVSNFLDYSVIRLNVNKGPADTYEKFMTGVYNQNKYKLDEGSYKIRYTFQNLDQCTLVARYIGDNDQEKEVTFSIYSPNGSQTVNNDEGNILSFMFKPKDIAPDFDASKIVTLDIAGLTPQIDLYSTTGTVLNISKFYTRFGYLSVITRNDKVSTTSVSLITFLFFLGYTLVYAGLTILMFFYKKEKYKNDEFRRVKPAKFIKSAIIGYVGSLVASFAVFFICMRSTLFASTMVVHNPMDGFVIGFSLVGLIAIGYGIRTLVVTIKSEKQRQMRIKLKLNEETADDGTK